MKARTIYYDISDALIHYPALHGTVNRLRKYGFTPIKHAVKLTKRGNACQHLFLLQGSRQYESNAILLGMLKTIARNKNNKPL